MTEFSRHPRIVGAAVPPVEWAELMARAQGGDRDAYRTLLTRLVPLLTRAAARSLRNRADVEETVQEILLTVHAVRHTYDPARPFLPWLLTIARRRVIDRLRHNGRSTAREVLTGLDVETFAAPAANPQERDWSPRALEAAIARLPETQKQAVTMLKLREMTLADAASESGLSVAALKTATHRALKRLRAILERWGGDE